MRLGFAHCSIAFGVVGMLALVTLVPWDVATYVVTGGGALACIGFGSLLAALEASGDP